MPDRSWLSGRTSAHRMCRAVQVINVEEKLPVNFGVGVAVIIFIFIPGMLLHQLNFSFPTVSVLPFSVRTMVETRKVSDKYEGLKRVR